MPAMSATEDKENKPLAAIDNNTPNDPFDLDLDFSPDDLVQPVFRRRRTIRGRSRSARSDPDFIRPGRRSEVRARKVLSDEIGVKGSRSNRVDERDAEVAKAVDDAGSYVALTLLGKGQQVTTPTQPTTPSTQSSLNQGQPPPPYSNVDASPVMSSAVAPPGGQVLQSAEKTAISGPTAVDPQMDKELRMQKISMIRFMYEKECDECEKLTEALRQNPNQQSVQNKLEEKLRIRGRLGDQLYQLTGIPTESHITSPKSPPSGLPPPGVSFSTPPPGPQRPPMKRYGSGDGLHNIVEDKENTATDEPEAASNPAPWLPAGPKHRKAESMPESAFCSSVLPPSGKNVTVARSNSDSRKQSPTNQTDMRDGANTVSADEIEKLRTSSLPTSYNSSSPDQSANQNAASSPTHTREAWEETSETTMSPTDLESPNTTRGSGTSMSPPREIRPNLQVVSPLQADVIPMEEEEEVNMDDEHIGHNNRFSWPIFPREGHLTAHSVQLEDHGPFSDLNRLKHKPAHLAVFLYYLISNSDPSPLLFYLVTEQYTQGTMRDMRRWAYEIYSTFLVQSAAIKVEELDATLLTSIEQTLQHKSDKEDVMRTVFQNVRHITQKQISELLADFRQKRTLGLANFYGDNELSDNMDKSAELKTVESKLLPHLEKCNRDIEGGKASSRDHAMAWALATIMKQLGVSPAKNSTALERCQSFISKDKKGFKIGSRSNKKNGHHFNPTQYHSTAYCSNCGMLIWGIGYQGFQCQNCDINVHKHCLETLHDTCTRKKKEKRTSMLHMLRKTTNPNPAAIKEAQQIHDERGHVSSHMGGHMTPTARDSSMFQIRSSDKGEEEEDLDQLRTANKVSNLVEKFSEGPRDDQRPVGTPPRSRSPDTMETDDQLKRKSSTNLGRSESLNKKRESRRSVRRTRSDVHVDDKTLKSLNQSESSSNSSLSNRSLDSPSTSAEALSEGHHPGLAVLQEDSDFETEPELPPLDAAIPKDQLKKLKKSEKKRQEVINELFYTERAHVRDLKVLDKIFRLPLNSMFGDQDMIDTLFPGLTNLIEVHSQLNNRFKNTRKETCVVGKVADLILSSFAGEAGEEFKKSCAIFCRDQSHALDYIRNRQRKDQKFANFLQEASSNPLCRRLELKDIIPKAMQRLTKYPLLIDSLLKDTSKNSEEHSLLQRAGACSREILNYVNQAVKDRENEQKLEDMQRKLDKRGLDNSKYQNFDLRHYHLIHDGSLTWRINKQKQINLKVLLLNQYLVLLQKQQDDRLVLKYQSTARDDSNKSTFSPILQLSNLMVRPVATDKHAIFLISDGEFGPQIYELVGNSTDAMKKWFKYLSESTSDHRREKSKGKGGDVPSGAPPRPSSMVVPDTVAVSLGGDVDDTTGGTDSRDKKESSLYPKAKSHSLDGLETIDHVEVHSVTDPVLAQPCEVVENTVQVNTAAPTRTPSERLKEQESIIGAALVEKRVIVAEILGVPVDDFSNISEMASEVEGDKDPRELILGSLHQTDRLTCLVNSSLRQRSPDGATTTTNITVTTDAANNNTSQPASVNGRTLSDNSEAEPRSENEAGSSSSNQNAAGADNTSASTLSSSSSSVTKGQGSDFMMEIASSQLLAITAKLNSQLHQLMEVLATREKEHERLQTELNAVKHQLDNQQLRSPNHSLSQTSRPNSYISMTSSTSEDPEMVTSVMAVTTTTTSTTTELSRHQIVLKDYVVESSSSTVQHQSPDTSSQTLLSSSDNSDAEKVEKVEKVEEVPNIDKVAPEEVVLEEKVSNSAVTNSLSSSGSSSSSASLEVEDEEAVEEDTFEGAEENQESLSDTPVTSMLDSSTVDDDDKLLDNSSFATPPASSSPVKTSASKDNDDVTVHEEKNETNAEST